jgi:hypothetical protein
MDQSVVKKGIRGFCMTIAAFAGVQISFCCETSSATTAGTSVRQDSLSLSTADSRVGSDAIELSSKVYNGIWPGIEYFNSVDLLGRKTQPKYSEEISWFRRDEANIFLISMELPLGSKNGPLRAEAPRCVMVLRSNIEL